MAKKQRKKKNPAAQALGALGARATNSKLTAEERSESARYAAQRRWEEYYKNKAASKNKA